MDTLSKKIDEHDKEISSIRTDLELTKKDLSNLTKDVSKDIKSINNNVQKLMESSQNVEKRFIKMDQKNEIKGNLLESLGTHWWKILLIVVPVVLALGELMVYLRKLPPP